MEENHLLSLRPLIETTDDDSDLSIDSDDEIIDNVMDVTNLTEESRDDEEEEGVEQQQTQINSSQSSIFLTTVIASQSKESSSNNNIPFSERKGYSRVKTV
ncbi:unnamed protein product [Adineta ricciae]|uniref:Uncharacterized protein n=1 Tax=Adineta ricciae TaxID=249248 RepID=A0A815LPY2_ADIRI|nr:unnamed protein product [Adineta ricciae]CAF1410453.1 unnamed protein product [Adineta ricciae]